MHKTIRGKMSRHFSELWNIFLIRHGRIRDITRLANVEFTTDLILLCNPFRVKSCQIYKPYLPECMSDWYQIYLYLSVANQTLKGSFMECSILGIHKMLLTYVSFRYVCLNVISYESQPNKWSLISERLYSHIENLPIIFFLNWCPLSEC